MRTMQATLGLSGRAGTTTLRGNVDAGFEAPDRIRLEGRHPLGRPVFILVGRRRPLNALHAARRPRAARRPARVDRRGARRACRSRRASCGRSSAAAGSAWPSPPGAVNTPADTSPSTLAGATTYLRREQNVWRVAAATRAAADRAVFRLRQRPSRRRCASSPRGTPRADLTVRLSDVNINVPMDAAVFAVDVPAAAQPLTLDELRRAGPLGGE